ncbi:MAG: replication and repair protein recF [Chlamydiota bacterium]|jgi:DNA replication and repair protein RecF
MHLLTLSLRHFRSHKEAQFTFSPTLNCIVGKNGQGKTNLLEAISLVSTGRSFRTHNLRDLIHFGESFFYIEATFQNEGIEERVSIYFDGQTKKVEHNTTTYSTLHSLLGKLPSVILTPEDSSLISGSPQERRRFLDLYISQIDPLYLYHLSRYFKALKQRNELLKNNTCDSIASWEEIMSNSACYLITKRQSVINELSPRISDWSAKLSSNYDALSLQYLSRPKDLMHSPDIATALQKYFEQMREKELILGHTLIGPQRDDILFQLKEQSAKAFSSQGQKRSCLFALRFAEWECMAHASRKKPLLGLDDFGIHLDATRLEHLKSALAHFGQVFLTSPEFSCVPHHRIEL